MHKSVSYKMLLGVLLLLGTSCSVASAQDEEPPWQDRGFSRRLPNLLKNNAQMKSLLKPVAAPAGNATVQIFCDDHRVALGTIVAADGLIATKASQLSEKIECRLSDGRKLTATLVGEDEATDMALLRVDAKGLTPIVWAAAAATTGSIIAAAGPNGDPLGVGVISDAIRSMPGLGSRNSPHGWLGIGVGTDNDGPEVQNVSPGSAAEKAGLKMGDRIKRLNGRDLRSADELIDSLSKLPANKHVALLVQRDEKELKLEATLGRSPGKLSQDHWGGGPFSDRRWGFAQVISHDLAIAPTDCGGPLVDLDGRCLGINIARALRVTTYALPSNVVKETIAKLSPKEKK